MRVPRSYTNQALAPGQSLELEPAPSGHLARVLRMEAGDALVLFNGDGRSYPSVLTSVNKRTVSATVKEVQKADLESPLRIHLGIVISRGERMDWVMQKATELGAHAITPLFSERCSVKLRGERADKKLRHWQQIAISACEQSGRNCLPAVTAAIELSLWLTTTHADRRFVLHPRATSAAPGASQPTSIALLVGPEGGLSDEEIILAEQSGFEALKLGPRVLRTETAPLAAITVLQSRWGDMQTLL